MDVAGTLAGRRPATREKVFEAMVLVARTLIEAREVGQILSKVVDLLFDFLPAERAVVVLLEEDGRPTPTLARRRGKDGPDPEPAFSHTIVDSVVRDRVAVLTSDALADGRFEAGQSIRIQQIRSAMCVPLWDRDRVIGALHVDTPLKAGTFTADDLDLLTALGNFAAVAIERARLQGRIEREERIRERLARYHSPGVVDEIVTGGPQGVESVRTREVTVFFADIVGFTTSAETMDPEELSRFLETVFTFAADAIFEQGGTLDKFIGDAVMAFFGAPIPQPDHARRAVAAAAKLVESLIAWNAQRATRGERPVAVHGRRAERGRRRRRHGAPGGLRLRVRAAGRAEAQGPLEGPDRVPPQAGRGGPPDPSGVRDPLEGLAFVTSNPGKAREASAFLGRPVEARPLDLPEIQSLDFREVARAKALVAVRVLGVPVLVEDSGLSVAGWGGFPGPFTKWITMGALGQEGLARMVDGFSDRSAEAVSVLAVARPGATEAEVLVAEGRVTGSIALHPRGERGFGWDVLFIPEGGTRTYAEMAEAEKNALSHRARAFGALRARLGGPG